MIALNMRTINIAAIIFLLGIVYPKTVISQNCGCPAGSCCSQFGYCGTGQGFCGPGCQEGPCTGSCHCASDYCCSQHGFCGTGDAYCGTGCQEGPCYDRQIISNIVTEEFFDSLINQSCSNCPGRNFYTRQMFLEATNFDTSFATTGTIEESKRELAAFFAHAMFLTGQFCLVEELQNAVDDYTFCDNSTTLFPCACGKEYYGRGPLQMRSNLNYGSAGQAIGFDGLGNPEIVARSPLISFGGAIWYWMEYVHPVINQGFGATIKALSPSLCTETDTVETLVELYKDYCNEFGVDPGSNLYCLNEQFI